MADQRYTRRDALAVLGGVVVAGPAAAAAVTGQEPQRRQGAPDSLVADLMDPTRAGKLRARVTAYENDPVVVGVEEKIRCTCGCNLSVYTCRTTDFTCETSPAMHERVVELMEQQKSAQEILDAFVTQYGESVLMAPPRAGFNLAGYLVPGILITLVGGALALVIVRQTRMQAVRRSAGQADDARPSASPPGRPDTDEQARIKAELEKLGM